MQDVILLAFTKSTSADSTSVSKNMKTLCLPSDYHASCRWPPCLRKLRARRWGIGAIQLTNQRRLWTFDFGRGFETRGTLAQDFELSA